MRDLPLFENKKCCEMESNNRESIIHAAIEQADTERLRELLSRGGDVEEKDANGTTPLGKAVERDCPEMVELLLNAGADVNASFRMYIPFKMWRSAWTQNALSYAIDLFIIFWMPRYGLTPERHQIIRRLIAAGANLDVADHYTAPLQNACHARHWPVVVDLIEAGSKVDIRGPNDKVPLVTAASGAIRFSYRPIPHIFNSFVEEEYCPMNWPSRKKAMELLIERSRSLRRKTNSVSLFKCVIRGQSASVLCMLLKADKPAYGIDEAVDVLNFDQGIDSIVKAIPITLKYSLFFNNRLYRPFEITIASLFQGVHNPYWNKKIKLGYIRRQFAILRLLLDVRVIVYNLDENFKQFLRLIEYRLNTDYSHGQQSTLEYCNQVLNVIESRFDNPRNLREMCRSRVRYELNIRGLCVHHIRDNITHIVRDYLLYDDVPEPEAYLVYEKKDG